MKFTAEAFAFLTCVTLLSTIRASAARLPFQQLRCQCVKLYSGKPINSKHIENVQKIPAGPQCKNVEIIATLKQGLACLNPKDDWVQKMLKK